MYIIYTYIYILEYSDIDGGYACSIGYGFKCIVNYLQSTRFPMKSDFFCINMDKNILLYQKA